MKKWLEKIIKLIVGAIIIVVMVVVIISCIYLLNMVRIEISNGVKHAMEQSTEIEGIIEVEVYGVNTQPTTFKYEYNDKTYNTLLDGRKIVTEYKISNGSITIGNNGILYITIDDKTDIYTDFKLSEE